MNKRRSRNKKQVSLSQSLLRKKTNRETHNTNVFSSTAGNSTNFSDSNESQSSNDTQRPTRANSTSLPNADDFDDSFDLFLPRKPNFSKSSLQSSLFEVKKKSRYFNESGELRVPQVIEDDDLELAIAVSLQESKGKSVCLKPTKTTTTSQPRGRLKQAFAQSLLMRRTPEDRERIVTEKVAIVLMNTDKLPPCNTQLPDYPHSLYSSLLRKQFDEVKPLWTISQIDLSKIEPDRFYTSIIVGYTSPLPRNVVVSSSESNASGDENDTDKASNGGLKLAVSSEDIFGCSDSEAFSQCPSPKRPRNSTSNENLTAQNYGTSPGNGSCNDPLVLRVEPTDLFNPDYRQKPAVDQLSQPTVWDEVVSLDHGVCQMECDDHQEPRHTSPAAKSLKQLSQLSSDLRSLSTTAISKVISIDKGFKTLYAHTGVFRARCQLLGEELERNDKCLDEYTWAVCDALFDFIYAADSSKVLKLSREEKRQMIELCSRFKIVGLLDETGVDEEISPSVTTQVSSSQSNSVTKQFISSKCESSADVEEPEVIELDSEGGTVDEGSDRPVNAGTDDEFDLHLKDGIRLLDRAPVTSSIHQGDNVFVKSDPSSPSKSELITPKRSLDKYFEDSFPSFADIKATPRKESTVDTVDAPGASKPPIINCLTPGGKLIVSEVATPLPDYASMASPELQGALQNYGIRTDIGRRKAVTLLNYIYDQIHPPRDHPAVVKALNDVARARAEQAASSESDFDIHSLSSDASDLEAFEELGDVTSTDTSVTVEPEASLLKKISCFFKRNSNLYVSILRYEPIWLNQIHRTLKEEGVKCSKKELIASLDELGITFRTEQSEKQIQRRRTRNANRRRR